MPPFEGSMEAGRTYESEGMDDSQEMVLFRYNKNEVYVESERLRQCTMTCKDSS